MTKERTETLSEFNPTGRNESNMGEGERQEDSELEPFEKVPGPLMGSHPVGHCGLPLE